MSAAFWLGILAAQAGLLALICLVRMQRLEAEARATLRDYFAAKAMHAIVTTTNSWKDNGFVPRNGWSIAENNALCAYELADAMLKARAE